MKPRREGVSKTREAQGTLASVVPPNSAKKRAGMGMCSRWRARKIWKRCWGDGSVAKVLALKYEKKPFGPQPWEAELIGVWGQTDWLD